MVPVLRFGAGWHNEAVAIMRRLASAAPDIAAISNCAHQIYTTWVQNNRDVRLEQAPPSAPQVQYVWLSWAWDGYRWQVVRWDGYRWVPV